MTHSELKAWAVQLGWDEDLNWLPPERWLVWHLMNSGSPPGTTRADHFTRLAGYVLTGEYGTVPGTEELVDMNEFRAEEWFDRR